MGPYSTKRRRALASQESQAGDCHLVEGAESRIGPAKTRSDRILICLSRQCRRTDVKGKREGCVKGGLGLLRAAVIRLFTSDRETNIYIYMLIASLQFCFTFFMGFTGGKKT